MLTREELDRFRVDFERMTPSFLQLGAQVMRGEDRVGLNRIVPAP
jgi:hypothetical protein